MTKDVKKLQEWYEQVGPGYDVSNLVSSDLDLVGITENELLSQKQASSVVSYSKVNKHYIHGGTCNDTYSFNRGYGHYEITDRGGNDRIVFGRGITQDDLIVNAINGDIIIGLKEGDKPYWQLRDTITIKYAFTSELFVSGLIESFEFADGTKLDIAGLMNHQGTSNNDFVSWYLTPLDIDLGAGNDNFFGGDHGNIIRGGKGNDLLHSGKGNDTYIFNRGDGQDVIHDRGGNDRIVFGRGITKDDLTVNAINGDIIIGLKEGNKEYWQLSDTITIKKAFTSELFVSGLIESFEFADATKLDIAGLMNLQGTSNNDFVAWGVTPLDIDLGDGDDYLCTGNLSNTIRGGRGNDRIECGKGNDTYIFNRGDGQDIIKDRGGNDTVRLNGICRSEFGLFSGSDGLGISYGNGDHITFNGKLERIERGDGSYLTEANINYIIQEIAAFSRDKGISFSSAHDVQNNRYLNNFIAAQWNRY